MSNAEGSGRDARPLSGKVALVTGASRRVGIGWEISLQLARLGADVHFTHWGEYDATMPWGADEEGPETLIREIEALGVRASAGPLDLSSPDAATEAFDLVEERLGPVSILVNNATHSTHDGYEKLDAEILDRHYAVNIRGTFLLSVEFARRFRFEEDGRIVCMSTGISVGPMPDELAYSSTKAAVEGFVSTLAVELAGRGITVNAVDPGVTDTGWLTEELEADLVANAPRGRLGKPFDAARLIGFLATPEAGWVTGQVIHSDGAFHP